MPTPFTPTRRDFIKTTALATLAGGLAPPLLTAASTTPRSFRHLVKGRKVRLACIGVAGQGFTDVRALSDEEIVALCDVHFERGRRTFERYPQVPRYRDFRQMLAEVGDRIDAVVISTPDHAHFAQAMMAIELGKHVYVQKPLTHTIAEARALKVAAARAGVVTQMGNQGHANEGTRLTKEWVEAGVIGTVREAHVWTDRPTLWYPRGIPARQAEVAPANVDWNLWLNVAPESPYNARIASFGWRGYWDYGCGALGDMGCHALDATFYALDLRGDAQVSATSSGGTAATIPDWSIVTYDFPARGSRAPVKVYWYDGTKQPPVPEELGAGATLPANGCYLVGDRGIIYNPDLYNASPRLVPEERMQAFTDRPKKTIPRVPRSNPHLEWIMACKGEGPAPSSNIVDYSADLTEMVLLGNIAVRTGRPIQWDSANLSCVNDPAADVFVHKFYRLY